MKTMAHQRPGASRNDAILPDMELFHLCRVGCEMNKTGFILAALAAVAALVWLVNRSAFFPIQYPAGEWDNQAAVGAHDVG